MAQQDSTGKGQDANVNTASTSSPEDVEPTKIEETTVEKPAMSPSSTKAPARKTTSTKKTVSPEKAAPKKKTVSRKKAAPKKKAIPKKKAAPKKRQSAQTRVAAAAADLAESKTQSPPEELGQRPQPTDRSTSRVIHVRKRTAVWPWVILVAVVGVGTYLLNTGRLTYLVTGDKESTASHADDTLETKVTPPTGDRGEPSAPTLTREDIDRPITTTQDVEPPGQRSTVAPSSIPPFGGRFAEESVIPHGTAVTPSTSETEMTRIDESSYPPLQPSAPLPTERTRIEPQRADVEEIAPEVQTTVTTTTEMQTAPSPWSRDQDFGGRDAPVTDAESQVPDLSKKHPETDPRDPALSSENYGTAETKKSVTGIGEELPQASGSTPEAADKSKAKPEVRPRASRRLPPTPPYYWNRPYRPYGPYGTYGRYPTYPPAAPRPYPYGYGYGFVNPRQKDTK